MDGHQHIVAVWGKQGEERTAYTESELLKNLENNNNDFYYSMAAFTRNDQPYYYLVKIPMDRVDNDKMLDSKRRDKLVHRYVFTSIAGFILSSSLVIFIYSRLSARKIKVPLQQITEGIEIMIQGNYKVRLQFEAESEFLTIRDAFNYMADQLQKSEAENRNLELGKRKLLADIAHDLRTPISTIQSFAKALHDGMITDTDQQNRYLSTIFHKSERVQMLMDSLFEITLLDTPTYSFNIEEADLCEWTRELIAEHYTEIERHGIVLELDIPDISILYPFDRKQMARVVSNLITNTVKYNPEGTRLFIQVKKVPNQVILEFADTGVGIPESLHQSIFDPFVRGDETRSSTGGTGLGLSISKKIVEKHGGTLDLIHSEAYSTVFRISLPDQR
ncbi:HAMP domain-containing sensor histidine kinase [Paenibacillus filicis]|uniref:histidine kinase n=1 Tax=Paenibacillus gyeongsangnamensis TaxID=3388067 RepID=A0ABT4QI47_9BACL|nr:HAMP domain-containing sensor histidine kinase [Paenibacillus filicis]MCZ8516555.1 HAMP domain-containing sensor histidine kinase [Paenibacillus filicis]